MCIFQSQEAVDESFLIYGHMTKIMNSFKWIKGTTAEPSLHFTEKTQMKNWLTEAEAEIL